MKWCKKKKKKGKMTVETKTIRIKPACLIRTDEATWSDLLARQSLAALAAHAGQDVEPRRPERMAGCYQMEPAFREQIRGGGGRARWKPPLSVICLIPSDVQPRQKHKLSQYPCWHLLHPHIVRRGILKDLLSEARWGVGGAENQQEQLSFSR